MCGLCTHPRPSHSPGQLGREGGRIAEPRSHRVISCSLSLFERSLPPQFQWREEDFDLLAAGRYIQWVPVPAVHPKNMTLCGIFYNAGAYTVYTPGVYTVYTPGVYTVYTNVYCERTMQFV